MSPFDVDRMWAWIEAIVAFGPRRPGTRAGLAFEADLVARLAGFGFEDVRREPIPITVWHEGEATLDVSGPSGEVSIRPEVQAIPHSAATPATGVEGPLLFVDSPSTARGDWRGAIVVVELGFPALKTGLLLKTAIGSYDPDGTLGEVNHPATWVRLNWYLYREAQKRGAAGFVGILKDQPGGSCRMYAPYGFREGDHFTDKPLPGVWIGRDDGSNLKAMAQGGGARGRLRSLGTTEPGVTHNVVAELPGSGPDDEVIVLSCHHDSPFNSPVEDASGCSVVLALAERLAGERPLRRRLVVLFSAGHFHGSIGTRRFIEEHRSDIVARTAVEVSIEHIAREAIEGPDGALIPTGRPEATAMFVSFSPEIAGALLEAVEAQGVDRVILLPAEGPLGDYPPTDGGDWFEAGVPVINCISNPVYLLTDGDALAWVDRNRLPRMASAFDQVLRRLDLVPRRSLASTKSWPYRLAMRGLGLFLRAKVSRMGTRSLH